MPPKNKTPPNDDAPADADADADVDLDSDSDVRLPGGDRRTLVSFDVGIRHLAFCVLEEDRAKRPRYRILDWRVVDLLAVRGTPYDACMVYVESKGWKVAELRAWLQANGATSDGGRAALVDRVHKTLKAQGVRKRRSNDVAMLASKLFAFLDSVPQLREKDAVVFENQPCLVNPVMKSVQMMLYSYFVYHGVTGRYQEQRAPLMSVAMRSATNKLRDGVLATAVEDAGSASATASGSAEEGGLGGAVVASAPSTAVRVSFMLACGTRTPAVPVPKGRPLIEAVQAAQIDASRHAVYSVGEPSERDPHATLCEADALFFLLPRDKPNKPKKSAKPASAYKARKLQAIRDARCLLAAWGQTARKWREYFERSSTKAQDDLSDCLLQALYTLQSKPS
jgi:hypothetical protein